MTNIKILISTLILTIFTFIFIALSPKTYAAVSPYEIANLFTFSRDMDIDEGFELIKPYILYRGGFYDDSSYELTVKPQGGYTYKLSGVYPDNTKFSRIVNITVLDNASGCYVEAELTKPYRQTIYIKKLYNSFTPNDCLMECWANNWVNIQYPEYNIVNGVRINFVANHLTSFITGAGDTENLQYFAIVPDPDPIKYTPTDINPDYSNPNDDISQENSSNNNSNNNATNNSSNTNKNQSSTNSSTSSNKKSEQKDPVLLALMIVGVVLGFILICFIYKTIQAFIIWLTN